MTWPQGSNPDPYQQPQYGQQPPYGQSNDDPYAAPQPPSYGQPTNDPYAQQPPSQPWDQTYQQSPTSGQPYGQPTSGQPYGQQGYPQQPYSYPGYAVAPQSSTTNTMAILALIFAFVFSPLGIVFGHIAKKQIKERGEQGDGLATWGLILGYVFTGLSVLLCCGGVLASIASNSGSTY
ncbi:MAG TPA: DUF4190 domain-containing protein [Micromonosporaceae bacterium]